MAGFDKLIHERARLLIITLLASSEEPEVSFNNIQEQLGLTAGNLSVQLKKLKEAGYIKISKTFKDNKPYTAVEITLRGKKALDRYVTHMQDILKTVKK